MSTVPFAAAVVAGGLSTRMGEDKASLPWKGATFLEHRLAILRSLDPAALYLSTRGGQALPIPADVEIVADLPPYLERGPLGGLFALLSRAAAAGHTRVLVLAVDMPRMSAEWLARLVAAHLDGAMPELSGGRLEPLAALWPTALLPEIKTALDGNDASLHRLARAAIGSGLLDAVPVSEAEEGLFLNVNRKSDFEILNASEG